MLARSQKLDRAQFTLLKENKETRTVYNALGTLYYLQNPQNRGFSVVISSKVVKRAVHRNKIRRRLYTLFRNHKNITVQGILYTAKNIQNYTHAEINTYFEALFAKTTKNTQ